MKKFNWVKCWLIPCITFGIYNCYMWIVMTKNSNKIAEACGAKKIMGFIPAFLLACVTCGIYLYVWLYKFQAQQVAIAKANGTATKPTENAFLLFLLGFVPIYSYIVLCDNYNRNVDAAAFAAPAEE